MAEALVSFLVGKLKDAIESNVRLVIGAEDDLQCVSSTFSAIQALFRDAGARQFTEESLRNWIVNVKDVAYDLDDILDEWRTLKLIEEINESSDGSRFIKKVRHFLRQYSTRFRMASRVREIREKLDAINDDKEKYGLLTIGKVDEFNFGDRQSTPIINESEVMGRNHDKDLVITRLMNERFNSERGICVISIVGTVGLGKTTIAQLVYNDDRLKNHFKNRVWLWVSPDFNVTRLTKQILDGTGNKQFTNGLQLSTIQEILVEILKNGPPFLVVLDDLWNEERTQWETFMLPFNCSGTYGSKILITTRSEKVARIAESTYIHRPTSLSEEDSWALFSSISFTGKKGEEYLEFHNIGKQIVQKCSGVPLSLKKIGSVVRSKMKLEDWEHVLQSEMYVSLQEGGRDTFRDLLLSYDKLPLHLKPCFAYHAIFPKGYKIKRDELIKLWMAEGSIRYEEGRQMEKIGSEYFDDLLCYSFFQVPYKVFDQIQYNMHPLLHDLARYVNNNECYVVVDPKRNVIPARCRHLSLIEFGSNQSLDIASLSNLKCLRTIFFPRRSSIKIFSLDLLEQAKFLRILDLQNSAVTKLPNSIGTLLHLRYLNLSHTRIKELPESVCNLCNLQTLDLNECKQLSKLPVGLRKLVKLRHLMFQCTDSLVNIPNGIGRLTELQTLTKFIVGGEGGCKMGELGELNLLRGCLEIKNLERVVNGNEACDAKLEKKQHLQQLHLHWDETEWGMLDEERSNEILESLIPSNPKLEHLVILNYVGSMFPMSMGGSSSFSKLTFIVLRNCIKCRELPTLGNLPSLEHLHISFNVEMELVGSEFTGNGLIAFPKLKVLEFVGMPNWKEWQSGVVDGGIFMPCLLHLEILDCPLLTSLPDGLKRLKFLNQMSIRNCSQLHVKQDLGELKSLRSLSIGGMRSPPRWIWQQKSLYHLSIFRFDELRSIPPEVAQLTALKSLHIYECPDLKESYKQGIDQDWFKMAHIGNIRIDDSLIKCGGIWRE